MAYAEEDPLDISAEHSVDADLHRIEEPVRIGRYRLCYELGAGGMASVYLARAEGPGGFAKAVAIKRIHPHLARRKDLVEMFLDEARIASLISHPNVCNTFDFGEVDGTYFLAMEYLVGEPLSLIERRVVKTPELLASARWQRCFAKIVADAAEGLHAAHELKDERGRPLSVVHRDVSPQNLFVTYDGVAKVVDFGVAFATDRITRTVTGGIKGKLGYLAPEQLARAPYDRRLDVWALGIVLWEGLTGQRLFLSRSEVDTLLAVQQREIPPPSRIVPSVPPALDAIVLHALRRSPDERYATARALSRDLVAWLAESGPPLTNVEVGELVSEICGDRRDVRAEVVASVLEVVPDSTVAANKRRGLRVATHTLDAPPAAAPEVVHDVATEIRAIEPPPPSGPPLVPPTALLAPAPSAPFVAPLAPAPMAAPMPPATYAAPPPASPHPESRTMTRLVGLVGLAVLALSAVAISAIVTVGSRGADEIAPAPAPGPVPLATLPPGVVPPPPPLPITTPAPVVTPSHVRDLVDLAALGEITLVDGSDAVTTTLVLAPHGDQVAITGSCRAHGETHALPATEARSAALDALLARLGDVALGAASSPPDADAPRRITLGAGADALTLARGGGSGSSWFVGGARPSSLDGGVVAPIVDELAALAGSDRCATWAAGRTHAPPTTSHRVPTPPGTISVASPVSVTVCLGARCVPTPTRFEDVPAGTVTLRIQGRDGSSWTERVHVTPGENTRVVVRPH